MMRWRQCIFPKMFLPLSDNFRQHSISQTLPIPNTLSKGSGGQTSGHKLYHLYFPFTFTKWCHNENVILVFTVLIGFTFGGCRSKKQFGLTPVVASSVRPTSVGEALAISSSFFYFPLSLFTYAFSTHQLLLRFHISHFHFLLTPAVASSVRPTSLGEGLAISSLLLYFSLSPHTICAFQCEAD